MANISINTQINLFRQNIAKTIAISQLPVSVLYYVFKDVLNEIGSLYENTLQKEAEELQKEVEDIKEHQE